MMLQTTFKYYIFIPCWFLICFESNKIKAEIKSKLFDAYTLYRLGWVEFHRYISKWSFLIFGQYYTGMDSDDVADEEFLWVRNLWLAANKIFWYDEGW